MFARLRVMTKNFVKNKVVRKSQIFPFFRKISFRKIFVFVCHFCTFHINFCTNDFPFHTSIYLKKSAFSAMWADNFLLYLKKNLPTEKRQAESFT